MKPINVIVYGIVLMILVLCLMHINVYKVEGNSMRDLVAEGSTLLGLNLTFLSERFLTINRGDKVVFNYTKNSSTSILVFKSVIGIPGDTCRIVSYPERMRVYKISSSGFDSVFYQDDASQAVFFSEGRKFNIQNYVSIERKVLENAYFLMGNLQGDSVLDSRRLGPIDKRFVVAKIVKIF